MRIAEFNKKVEEFTKGSNFRFTDELIGIHEERYQNFKYFLVYCNTNNVYEAFNSKKEVIEYINAYNNNNKKIIELKKHEEKIAKKLECI